MSSQLRLETLAVHAGRDIDQASGAVAAAIVQSVTFQRDAEGQYPLGYFYSSKGNPNRNSLEAAFAALEGGVTAVAFAFELPEPPPRHQFVPVAVVADLTFVSGHAPYRDGAFRFKDKVGRNLDLSEAQQAGLALLGCLRSLHDRFETLDAVKRILKLNAYVNCVPNFHELPSVSDVASAILEDVFGENGRHARTTVGVCSLPAGAAVEIELVVQVGIDRSEPKQNARPRSHRRAAQPAKLPEQRKAWSTL